MIKVIAVSISMFDPAGHPSGNGDGVGALSNLVYHNYRTGFSIPLSNEFGPSTNYACPEDPTLVVLGTPYALQVITSNDGVTHQTFLFTVYCAAPGIWITLS